MQANTHRFCVAPMLDWTDRHCRYFYRLISKRAMLYTEMVTTGAIIRGDSARLLKFNAQEHPLALQLGGSHPDELALCAKIAEDSGYDEVNLNLGCPSDRVQNGRFGACLMAEPEKVAECVAAMQRQSSIPVSIKTRIGIDHQDSYEELRDFIATVAQMGIEVFIIHARKAWLKGLSPKQNRDIPPLRYDFVLRLKQDFPSLSFVINGGISTLDQAIDFLVQLDGVMLGREIYHNPYLLADVDAMFFLENTAKPSRQEIILALIPYIQQELKTGVRLNSISRHLLGLFHGQPGAKNWRRHISQQAFKNGADEQVVLRALEFVNG